VPAGELDAASKETLQFFPSFLPDGRHYFYLSGGGIGSFSGYIGTLDSRDHHALPGVATPAQITSSGYIFFGRDKGLVAQKLDLNRLVLSGEAFSIANLGAPTTLLSSIGFPPDFTAALFTSVSLTGGSLAYVSGNMLGNTYDTQLVWYDRNTELGPAGPSAEYHNPGVTSDGHFIVFERCNPSNIYVLDTQKGVTTHVTTHMANDTFPVWSPDERTIVFTSDRDGSRSLYTRVFGSVGDDKLLLKTEAAGTDDWSQGYITYDSVPPHRHIWAFSLTESKAMQVTFSEFEERGGRISPDGHWIAYTAIEQGQSQLVIQSFPQPEIKTQVSTGGGSVIRWRHDARELYYLAPDATMMAVSIKSTATAIEASAPTPLFKAPIAMTGATRDYAVTADGRFLINVTNPAVLNPTSTPISVTLNWSPSLKN
jgi:hypothetical protein